MSRTLELSPLGGAADALDLFLENSSYQGGQPVLDPSVRRVGSAICELFQEHGNSALFCNTNVLDSPESASYLFYPKGDQSDLGILVGMRTHRSKTELLAATTLPAPDVNAQPQQESAIEYAFSATIATEQLRGTADSERLPSYLWITYPDSQTWRQPLARGVVTNPEAQAVLVEGLTRQLATCAVVQACAPNELTAQRAQELRFIPSLV